MKKILIIEDNCDILENIAETLELANYEVLKAEDGLTGVNLAIKERPDLIVCDIRMPALDGYGVLYLLSKNEEVAGIPFIFMTAKSDKEDIRKGMGMGADDYITKPFDGIELLDAVETRLKKAALYNKDNSNSMSGLSTFLSNDNSLQLLHEIVNKEDVDTRFCKKKEIIYMDGFYPKGIYFLSKGRVKTYRTNDQGKELITELYKEGDFFGHPALLEDVRYTDTAAALEDSVICLIPREEFFSILYKNADVSRKFIKMMSSNLKEKEEQLMKLAYSSVRKRVAEALSILSDRYKDEEESEFTISISREDLANLSGTATETTIRTLSDFKEEGLISINKSCISILNHENLVGIKN